jgi:hypothetical protein
MSLPGLIVSEPDQPAFGGAGFLTDWSQREPDGLIPGWGDIGLDGDPSTADVLHLAGHRDGIISNSPGETGSSLARDHPLPARLGALSDEG